ncbi:MAG TPA: hypothetical protein VGM75_24205, partial [Pseudonocardiaceae bacterium]
MVLVGENRDRPVAGEPDDDRSPGGLLADRDAQQYATRAARGVEVSVAQLEKRLCGQGNPAHGRARAGEGAQRDSPDPGDGRISEGQPHDEWFSCQVVREGVLVRSRARGCEKHRENGQPGADQRRQSET